MTGAKVTRMMPGTNIPAGHIDTPASTDIPAEHYLDDDGDSPSAIIEIDVSKILGTDDRWEFDSVLSLYPASQSGGHQSLVLLFCPVKEDPGWDRLSDVGEWLTG